MIFVKDAVIWILLCSNKIDLNLNLNNSDHDRAYCNAAMVIRALVPLSLVLLAMWAISVLALGLLQDLNPKYNMSVRLGHASLIHNCLIKNMNISVMI